MSELRIIPEKSKSKRTDGNYSDFQSAFGAQSVLLIQNQVFEVDGEVEAGFEGVPVRAGGGVLAVDGFDDDAAHRLESSGEQVVEESKVGLEVRRVFGHMKEEGLAAAPRFQDQLAAVIDQVGARQSPGELSS